MCQAGDENISHALSESDSCLYEAKRKGRDCVVASESGGTGTLWRAGMLQRALKEERIVAAYQVMVDLLPASQWQMKRWRVWFSRWFVMVATNLSRRRKAST